MSGPYSLSVIVPVYNERENLDKLAEVIRQAMTKINTSFWEVVADPPRLPWTAPGSLESSLRISWPVWSGLFDSVLSLRRKGLLT